jgi:hypothetical protein
VLPMEKLSVLIFSRGNVANTLNLVKDMHEVADEVVLMDASDKADTALLKKGKTDMKLAKLVLFHVPPIGYPDPLRMYALKKCKYKWVLYIDTDERISDALKKDIKQLISKGKAVGYALRRYEEVKDPAKLPLFLTWQIRLFKKDCVTFTGMPHEQAKVKGRLDSLYQDEYYMMHLSALMTRKTQLDYNEIEKFERLTYGMYDKKMMSYLSKFLLHKDKDGDKTTSGKILLGLINIYQKMGLKKKDQELTNFDYFWYYAMLDFIYNTLEGDTKGYLTILSRENKHIDQINKWQSEEDGKEVLEISKILNEIGLIKFLQLDKDEVIERINKRKETGAKLLLSLIKERYKELYGGKS